MCSSPKYVISIFMKYDHDMPRNYCSSRIDQLTGRDHVFYRNDSIAPTAWAPFQYKDGIILSYQYMGNSHVKGKTAGRTASLYWNGALLPEPANLFSQCIRWEIKNRCGTLLWIEGPFVIVKGAWIYLPLGPLYEITPLSSLGVWSFGELCLWSQVCLWQSLFCSNTVNHTLHAFAICVGEWVNQWGQPVPVTRSPGASATKRKKSAVDLITRLEACNFHSNHPIFLRFGIRYLRLPQ